MVLPVIDALSDLAVRLMPWEPLPTMLLPVICTSPVPVTSMPALPLPLMAKPSICDGLASAMIAPDPEKVLDDAAAGERRRSADSDVDSLVEVTQISLRPDARGDGDRRHTAECAQRHRTDLKSAKRVSGADIAVERRGLVVAGREGQLEALALLRIDGAVDGDVSADDARGPSVWLCRRLRRCRHQPNTVRSARRVVAGTGLRRVATPADVVVHRRRSSGLASGARLPTARKGCRTCAVDRERRHRRRSSTVPRR